MNQLQSIRRNGQTAFLGTMLVFAAVPALADSSRVVSVEEHWELRLGQPDPARSAPQATMVMSPVENIDGTHFLVTFNHATMPEYHPGGIQVQAWDGAELLSDASAAVQGALQNADEVVQWVQHLWIEDGTLHFQVRDGSSETWGSFGGDDLSLSVATTLTGLNSYRPGTSITESEVGYAENRVGSLVLTKLVWVTEDGQVHEQSAPIPIDTSFDQ